MKRIKREGPTPLTNHTPVTTHHAHQHTTLVAVAQGDVRGHMLLRGGDTPRDELRGERRAARLVQRAEVALGVEEHVRVRVGLGLGLGLGTA